MCSISNLPTKKFKLWAIFVWEMCNGLHLFAEDDEPDWCDSLEEWKVEKALTERMCPSVLQAMGVDLPWTKRDVKSCLPYEFYYGDTDCNGRGMHKPILIELELPHIDDHPLFPVHG